MYIATLRRIGPLFSIGAVLWLQPVLGATLTISAASSMTDAMNDAGHQFERKSGDHLVFNFLASGPLAKQIEEGAPIDLFISAADKQMEELKRAHLIDPATERVVARGEMVLIVPAGAKDPPTSFAELAGPRCKRLAIGAPKSVPAGDYAMQTLKSLHLAQALESRLVMAVNVRQVLDYVERGEVDAGLVYRTDALISKGKVKIVATADESTHQPIEYPAAVVKSSRNSAEAEGFLDFLGSSQGRDTLARYGFLSGEPKK
jgi:molybdate transport system substrate-binding protein